MDAAPSLKGTVVGGFRLVTELGHGGMGTVYFAEHQLIGRRAAIKILHPEFATNADLVARFFIEARAVNDIRHPNVVEITDVGEIEGRPYIIMELLEGETLGERLERDGTMPEAAVVRIARQMTSALGTAHERGIVHRDLKPENIFLTNHPDYPDFVKVLDFGIAKLVDPVKAERHTRAGMLLGTPAYMSPEQCMADETLGPASDIYSFGVVLYEMLCGRPPFVGANMNQIIVAHATQPPVPPVERNREIAPWLNNLVLALLAKSPQMRPSSMALVREMLDPEHCPSPAATPVRHAPSLKEIERRETIEAQVVVDKLVQLLFKRLEADRLTLPSMPGIAAECLGVLRDPLQTFASVAQVVARDPHLASRVLKLANSAAFQRRHPAVTIEQAISRVGTEGLTAALVEFSLHEVFVSRNQQIRAAFRGMWEHSLAVALLAKDLAAAHGKGRVDPNTAYLAGLLHDVGKPVVASFMLEAERMTDPSTAKVEWLNESVWKRVINGAHREVGRALAKKWDLALEVAAAVGNCEKYDLQGGVNCSNIVRLANALAKREGIYVGSPSAEDVHDAIGAGRTLMGLEDADLERVCNNLYGRVGTLAEGQPCTPGDAARAHAGERG